MKRFFILFTLVLSLGAFAQEFSGKATYQTKMIFKDFDMKPSDGKSSGLPPEIMKQFEESIKKSSEKTYFLEFTKDESFYTEEEKLAQPTTGTSNISVSFSGSSSGKLYKNLKENYSLSENEELGKIHLLKDTLHTSGWQLSTESKKIGNYTAYKATKTIKPKNYFPDDEKEDKTSENFLSIMDQKESKDIVYTAWYTPEIPIPNGPEKFGGLPGLILELHTDNMVYLCSEIVLNPKKPISIKEPKGKVISQEEYDEKIRKMYKNIQRNQRNQGKGNQQFIIIGG